MSDLRLYNTLTRAKQVFTPADPARVTMYVCGPTVYGRAHIGNARPAVVFDVLRRVLRHRYGADSVVYARNITDIDDKIIAAADAEAVPIETITRRFEEHYLADMAALGVEPPDLAPHATAYVVEMVAMIAELIARGVAYAAEGHALFDVGAFPGYGKLSGRRLDEMIAGARVEVAPYKKSPADFVLWKPSWPEQPGWDSPWGRGRPGWHIECSAMIRAVLGETIDIHGGGLDLIFPHHENEVAQSACAHDGAPLARVWMHNGFLSMGADKMSKSLGNVALIDDLLAAGWSGEVLRLALLSAHYRQPLEWNDALLDQTKATLDRWQGFLRRSNAPATEVPQRVIAALSDDLNTPEAVAAVARLARLNDVGGMRAALGLLGLLERGPLQTDGIDVVVALGSVALRSIPDQRDVKEQIEARSMARARKDYAEADRIRDELIAQGIVLEDGAAGTTPRRV